MARRHAAAMPGRLRVPGGRCRACQRVDVRSTPGRELPVLLLGKHITGLGVLRTLVRDGVVVYGGEETDDVITRSRWYRPAERRLPESPDADVLAVHLRGLPLARAVLIACSDRWTLAVAGLPSDVRERFPASINTPEVVRTFSDKARFRGLVERLGLPAPWSLPIATPDDLDSASDEQLRSAFLKPADSQAYARRFGTKGAFVSSRSQAAWVVREGIAAGTSFILQEFIPGPPGSTILLDGFVDRHGTLAAISARRRLRMDPPLLANTASDVMIELGEVAPAVATAQRLLAAVGYRGIFNIEFKHDARDGIFKIIELNARPFWLIAHIAAAGIDLPLMSYLDALEQPVPVGVTYQVGRYGLCELPDAAAILRAVRSGRRPDGPVLRPWLRGDHAMLWPSDPVPGVLDLTAGLRRRLAGHTPDGQRYLMASGVTGEPTAPVTTSGGALKRNS